MALTACVEKDNSVFPSNPEPQTAEKDFVERWVPVVDPKGEAQGTVMLRFYDDMPSVAYINVSLFQAMMYPGTTIQTQALGESRFLLTSPCGTAVVDTDKDTFDSDDYEAFTNMMGMVQPGMPNVGLDGLPLVRWKSMEATPQNVHLTLDYGKYGIDLRTDDSNVYFPLATIADLYTDIYMHIADYNGQQVMVAPKGAEELDNGYPASFIAPILKETRTKDMATFAYNNLCFTLTNLFGYPGRTLLEKKGLKEKGLDQALKDYGQAGTMTRELLLSTNMYDYIAGTNTLACLLNDGGHTDTNINHISKMDSSTDFYKTMGSTVKAKLEEFYGYCPEYAAVKKVDDDYDTIHSKLIEARIAKIGRGVTYYKEGNTAYCLFNVFDCDFAAWRKFYKGEGPKPTVENHPNDWLAVLLDGLEQAAKDPEVKNFVLDLSTNGGGSEDIVMVITSLMCNKAEAYNENSLLGQKQKIYYEVDRNLDGKFDEKDAEVKYNLRFALLVSPCSFSCGNMLPALMKDFGIPLIGQRTGGGSCAVLYNPSADGFGYRYSTHRSRLMNQKGENVDPGVEPDLKLESPEEFFDFQKISQFIEKFYNSK
jgi:hypothetical protein